MKLEQMFREQRPIYTIEVRFLDTRETDVYLDIESMREIGSYTALFQDNGNSFRFQTHRVEQIFVRPQVAKPVDETGEPKKEQFN